MNMQDKETSITFVNVETSVKGNKKRQWMNRNYLQYKKKQVL